MRRALAAFLATAISLASFAAAFAAISWFTHSTAFFWLVNYPHGARMVASTTSIFISVFVVPWLVFGQKNNAEKNDESEANKPAPRLWKQSFKDPEE
jgi:TRAP-type C4-dicarboxylate transport system permease small subunit